MTGAGADPRVSLPLKLYYYFLKGLGLIAFNLKDVEDEKEPCQSVFLFVAHLVLTVGLLLMFLRFFSLFPAESFLFVLLSFCTKVCLPLTSFTTVVWSKIYGRKVFTLFVKLLRLENTFRRHNLKVEFRKIGAIAILGVVTEILLNMSSFALYIYTRRTDKNNHAEKGFGFYVFLVAYPMVFAVMSIYDLLITMQYFAVYNCLAGMFDAINLKLDYIVENKRNCLFKGNTFKFYCKLYGRVAEVVYFCNNLYRIVLLSLLTAMVVLMTLQLYGTVVDVFLLKNFVNNHAILYGTFIMMFKMANLIWIAENVNSAARRIYPVLAKILLIYHQEKSNRKEVNAFFLQLLHQKVCVSAGGYFEIDLQLGFTVVTAVITYLVILVQTDSYGSSVIKNMLF